MVRNSSGVCAFYYVFLDFYSIFDIILRILSECRFCKKRKINAQIVKNSIFEPFKYRNLVFVCRYRAFQLRLGFYMSFLHGAFSHYRKVYNRQ